MTIEETLKRYAELKAIDKATKTELTKLGQPIREHLTAQGVDKLPTSLGSFTLKPVPVWTYSPAVEAAEAEVERLKAKEKADGIATSVDRVDLVFSAVKIQSDEE
jgi:hypothetical protein